MQGESIDRYETCHWAIVLAHHFILNDYIVIMSDNGLYGNVRWVQELGLYWSNQIKGNKTIMAAAVSSVTHIRWLLASRSNFWILNELF